MNDAACHAERVTLLTAKLLATPEFKTVTPAVLLDAVISTYASLIVHYPQHMESGAKGLLQLSAMLSGLLETHTAAGPAQRH